MSRPAGITYGPGSPYRPLGLPVFTPAGCAAGAHHARGTIDRDGALLWVCQRCPAHRVAGDPTWRAPS